MTPYAIESVVDAVGIAADCRTCGKRARYCACPDGATVHLDDVTRALENVFVAEGCVECPMGDF